VKKNRIQLNLVDNKSESDFDIVPLRRKRDWMTNTGGSFAYQCMPLNIANEFGWAVLNPVPFTATWRGDLGPEGVEIVWHEEFEGYAYASSHFGDGTLTINVDFVIKTPKGISTYIRGVPNEYIDSLHPLDAIVETDWLPFTFTYNYQFKDTCSVTFEKGEPLFIFFPIDRKSIEGYNIITQPISEDPTLEKEYNEYADARQHILENPQPSFQKFYKNAQNPDGSSYDAERHMTAVRLSKVNDLN